MRRRAPASALALTALVLLVLAAAGAAHADRRDEAWRRGNEAYLHGDYAAAAAAYEELEHQGVVSADSVFNLGDAYFRKGALGPAIWAFEKAAALDPGDEDARYNLGEARRAGRAGGARPDRGGGSRSALDPRRHRGGALYPDLAVRHRLLAFFALILWRLRARDDLRPALGAGVAVLGAAALLSGALLFGRTRLERLPFGVVLPDAVAVKDGADDNYRTAFEVHAGLRVRMIERDQDWLRVRLGNGLEGWVHASQIGTL